MDIEIQNNTMSLLIGFIVILLLQILIGQIPSFRNDDKNNSKNSHREMRRRIQHATTGHAIVLLSYFLSPTLLRCGQALIILAMMIIYYIHQYHFHTIYMKIAGPYLRPNELLHDPKRHYRGLILPGAWYFLLGVIITSLCFPRDIARYATMCLSYGDPIAAYVGQTIPSVRIMDVMIMNHPKWKTMSSPPKPPSSSSMLSFEGFFHHVVLSSNASLSGCIACFTSSLMIGYFMLEPTNNTIKWARVIVGAYACTISEAFPIFYNDNVTIPIVTAFFVNMMT